MTQVEKIPISVRTLDEFAIPNVGFLKIDVEGLELDVLEGAIKTISRDRPAMLIEIEQRYHPERSITDIFDRLGALGYRGYFVLNRRLHSIAHFDVHRMQTALHDSSPDYVNNFLFLTRELRSGRRF